MATANREKTAVPNLLNSLDLKDSLVTIDAIACNVKNADIITSKQGHYILALKNNNKHIYQQVSERLAQIKPQLPKNEHIDFGSGRIETRTCYVENDLTLYDDLAPWQHLKSITIIESTREIKDKISFETRYYLSDLKPEPKDFNQYIRNHWSIENSLHWQLDVTFREDLQRTQAGNASENLAIIRKLSLQLLNKITDKES
ncbi:ISAs1 family transposase [Arcicella rigui]|uniref:ISAs1 family transposase n=1 Tax=Arcicella rigui TaxID=797020 RepID=A0ABU5QF23_9BACT|nr:ISAs1 family transposase [Arcicella rigui]MEA5141470.1 ISAs1 family transposase [Arcicella rigui]